MQPRTCSTSAKISKERLVPYHMCCESETVCVCVCVCVCVRVRVCVCELVEVVLVIMIIMSGIYSFNG